ncbi:hypothetical protein CNZW441b_1209 [Campylobacter novaezeelandiae]|uniref:Uncharacterized protein n=1 Tax=Campylobacter novaezeelandiae TaxID=2267891 RepID=A0A4Q9JT92_9BACT|nr:hypothetical protein [Campylobacter novaezeelandiae]QWU79951.1 hypothetical protein CNZW441b_0633 [Campylobacter novaezeelandiae]QWU80510.1 hypothetical protein CNZW441b_1209 [Campylobacter novaezeelandiae]TBR79905.1 hypothetical protein DU473_06235 [Campylobacter novaezeelandiae]
MGLVYSQCCNQVIDTNLRYTVKPLLKLEEVKLKQENKEKNIEVSKDININVDNQVDTSKKDKLLDIFV